MNARPKTKGKLVRVRLDEDRMDAINNDLSDVLVEHKASLDEALSSSISLMARAIHLYGTNLEGQLGTLESVIHEVRDLLLEHLDDPTPYERQETHE